MAAADGWSDAPLRGRDPRRLCVLLRHGSAATPGRRVVSLAGAVTLCRRPRCVRPAQRQRYRARSPVRDSSRFARGSRPRPSYEAPALPDALQGLPAVTRPRRGPARSGARRGPSSGGDTGGRRCRRGRAACRACPASAMRPWWMTTMRDARRTVDRRWAMTIEVRPLISSAMPRSITRSVSGSTLAVASSRIRISGSRASARANATSWRSPDEKLAPRSRTRASSPSGRDAITRSAPTRRAAARMRSSSIVASPRPMLSRSVPANMNTSWLTATIRRRSVRVSIARMSAPSIRISPDRAS